MPSQLISLSSKLSIGSKVVEDGLLNLHKENMCSGTVTQVQAMDCPA
jgi:hypothetical protein